MATLNNHTFYQHAQLPCGIFDFSKPLNESSSETMYFMSSNCVSNRLQFGVTLAWIILTGLGFLVCIAIFLRSLKNNSWRFNVPCITLGFCCAISLSLFLIQISYFFAFRGYLRAICGGLIMATIMPGGTFLMREWCLKIIVATKISGQENLEKLVIKSFWIINISFQIFFWTTMLVAGAYDVSDINKNNMAVGMWYLVAALYAIVLALGIVYMGRSVVAIIKRHEDTGTENAKNLLKSARRVKLFSYFLGMTLGSTANFAIGLSIWAFYSFAQADKNKGMPYYFYIQQFCFFPSFMMVLALFVYIGAGGTRPEKSVQDHSDQTGSNHSNSAMLQMIREAEESQNKSRQSREVEISA